MLASSAVSADNAQASTTTFMPPSPCVFRLDALDAKVAALETSLGDGAPFARAAAEGGAAGGFFGAAFEGLGRVGDRVTAQGASPESSDGDSGAFGVSATGDRAAALGSGSRAEGAFSLAAGREALASETAALAFGNHAVASAPYSVALGSKTAATAPAASALGEKAVAAGAASSAFGRATRSFGAASTAMGDGASASGSG